MVSSAFRSQKSRGSSIGSEPVIVLFLDIRSRVQGVRLNLALLLDMFEHFAVPVELHFCHSGHIGPVVDRVWPQYQKEIRELGDCNSPVRFRVVVPCLGEVDTVDTVNLEMATRVIHVEACSPEDHVNLSSLLTMIDAVSAFEIGPCGRLVSLFCGHVICGLEDYAGLRESDRLLRNELDIRLIEQRIPVIQE